MLSSYRSANSKEVKSLPDAHYSFPNFIHHSFSVIIIPSISITLTVVVIIFMLVIIVCAHTKLLLVDHPPSNVPVLGENDDRKYRYVNVCEAEERNQS